MTWLVRPEGTAGTGRRPREFASAQGIVDALKDGEVASADDVRGPGDTGWEAVETHLAFAEIAADLDMPPPAPEEETHLDMNPMIDVSLVLLVFFILTATYATLTRSLNLPPDQANSEGSAKLPKISEIGKVVNISVKMEADVPVVRLDNRVVPMADLERDLTELVKGGGRKDAYLDIGPGVPWGVTVKVFEAAQGAEVQRTWRPSKKRAG